MGPQTVNVLQNLTTKLAEARGEELNAATAPQRGDGAQEYETRCRKDTDTG